MAVATFTATISTLTEALFTGPAQLLTVPGVDGELTVLANHEPYITQLRPGTIRVRDEAGEEHRFPVEKGLLEVSNNTATVLL